MKCGALFDPLACDGTLVHRGSDSVPHKLASVVLGSYQPARLPRRSAEATATADRAFWLTEHTPISDQGQIGSCWANAACDALEMLMNDPVQLSRLDLYWKARRLHGDECRDEGTYGRAVISALRDLGVCREETWPYDGRPATEAGARVNVRPSIAAAQEAFDHRIAGVYQVDSTRVMRATSTKHALEDGYPVMLSMPIGHEFERYFEGSNPDMVIGPPSREVGGHAVLITGYRERGDTIDFLVRNSWGLGGLDWYPGHVWISLDYLAIAYEVLVPTQTFMV